MVINFMIMLFIIVITVCAYTLNILLKNSRELDEYEAYIRRRNKSENSEGLKLCYCGKKPMCNCSDPELERFIRRKNKGIIK